MGADALGGWGEGASRGAPGLPEAVAVAGSGGLDRSAQSWTQMLRERNQVGGRVGWKGAGPRAFRFRSGTCPVVSSTAGLPLQSALYES